MSSMKHNEFCEAVEPW